MDNETFLQSVLNSQDLTPNQEKNIIELRKGIAQQIEDAIGGAPYVYYGGSHRKGTIIKANYDLDVVIHWRPNVQRALEEFFNLTGRTLQKYWHKVRQKRVGWQIPFEGNFHIDVVPGKFSSTNGHIAYLFNSDTGGRFQTSIEIQTESVLRSKRQDVIRLLKLWKLRKQVPIKTFILEQMIIEGCRGLNRELLETQLESALAFISDNIVTICLEDPANSSNIITDDLTIEQKYRIRKLAQYALNADSWGQVFTGEIR